MEVSRQLIAQLTGSDIRWYRRMLFGFVAGAAALVALAVGSPVTAGVSVIAALAAIVWAIWTRTTFSTLAGFFVGLAFVLVFGGLIGAARCEALTREGGSCERPAVWAVVAVGLVPIGIGLLFAALARRSGR